MVPPEPLSHALYVQLAELVDVAALAPNFARGSGFVALSHFSGASELARGWPGPTPSL